MSKAGIVFVGLFALQIAVFAAMVLGGPRHWLAPEVQPPSTELLAPVRLPPLMQSDEGYPEQVERPLFVAGRRPVVVETVAKPESDIKDMQMLGLFGPDDGTGGVIVSMSGTIRRVAVGAKVGALTLVRIEGLNAIFWDGAAERSMRLRPMPRPGAVPASTASSNAPAVEAAISRDAPMPMPVQPPGPADQGINEGAHWRTQ